MLPRAVLPSIGRLLRHCSATQLGANDPLRLGVHIHLLTPHESGAGDAQILRQLKGKIGRRRFGEDDAHADLSRFQDNLGREAAAEGDDEIIGANPVLQAVAEQLVECIVPADIGAYGQ